MEKSKRGFASMDPERQREIASKGGRSVAPENRSFSKDHRLAQVAGQKGGETTHAKKDPLALHFKKNKGPSYA